jgi:hypothetical protein
MGRMVKMSCFYVEKASLLYMEERTPCFVFNVFGFVSNDLLAQKSAIRVTELQNQASISRHIPNGIAAVSFHFLKGGHGV